MYLFGKFQALVIEIKSKIGHSCIFGTRTFSSNIATFVVVYLVDLTDSDGLRGTFWPVKF